MNGTLTRDPHAALAWLQAGRLLRIDAVNAYDWVRHIRALAELEARQAA